MILFSALLAKQNNIPYNVVPIYDIYIYNFLYPIRVTHASKPINTRIVSLLKCKKITLYLSTLIHKLSINLSHIYISFTIRNKATGQFKLWSFFFQRPARTVFVTTVTIKN